MAVKINWNKNLPEPHMCLRIQKEIISEKIKRWKLMTKMQFNIEDKTFWYMLLSYYQFFASSSHVFETMATPFQARHPYEHSQTCRLKADF